MVSSMMFCMGVALPPQDTETWDASERSSTSKPALSPSTGISALPPEASKITGEATTRLHQMASWISARFKAFWQGCERYSSWRVSKLCTVDWVWLAQPVSKKTAVKRAASFTIFLSGSAKLLYRYQFSLLRQAALTARLRPVKSTRMPP